MRGDEIGSDEPPAIERANDKPSVPHGRRATVPHPETSAADPSNGTAKPETIAEVAEAHEEVLEIDRARRTVRHRGRRVLLGGRAFDLLAALASRPRSIFAPSELLEAVWPGRVVEDGNLRVQIAQLRQRLGPKLILNVPGQGYRFEGAVALFSAQQDNRLIGREADLQNLARHAEQHRLVTVAGAGGIGKTSLVQAWYQTARVGVENNKAWMDLSALRESQQLLQGLATALGLAPSPGSGWTPAALAAQLPQSRLCLVLDNAEHVVDAVAATTRALLEHAPQLRLVVTSQVPLRLPMEHVFRLGALELPEANTSLERAGGTGAVALFVERVATLEPSFVLDAGNLADVAELCRRLDGLPLAIELAAARVPSLGVKALIRTLDERLHVLGSRDRAAPARQRTLRAALEWTHGLLDHASRTVFARLGAFAGPFTLEAAQQVVADEGDAVRIDRWVVIDALSHLVDASLVSLQQTEPLAYRLLESPRAFALEVLLANGESDVVRRRHLAWCERWVRSAKPEDILAGQGQLRAALEWALAGGDPAGGAAFAGRLVNHPALGGPISATPQSGLSNEVDDDNLLRLLQRLQAQGATGSATRAGIDHEIIMTLARRLRPDEVRDIEGALRELERAVDLAGSVLSVGTGDGRHASGDGHIEQVLARVAEYTRAGKVDLGSDQIDEALSELEHRELRQREQMLRARRTLLEAGVRQDLLRRDAFAVARRLEALIGLDGDPRPTWTESWRMREQQYVDEGTLQTVSLSLAVAIEMARRRLSSAGTPAERLSARRVLARALSIQGDRESGSESLSEAARACRDALSEVARADAPAEWAALQHELAVALGNLGARGGSSELLEEAVRCCEQALQLRTRASATLDWAATQHVLGSTLRSLAMRETGILRLEAAASALREALKELTPSRAPLERARSFNMLGNVLSIWATREPGVTRRHEAVAAQRSALMTLQREQAPLLWASVQTSLGVELIYLGTMESPDSPWRGTFEAPHDGSPELHWRGAVKALRDALTVHTRDSVPHFWARTQHNLAIALAFLGENQKSTVELQQAVDAMKAVLEENTRDRQPLAWSAGKHELGTALLRLGMLQPDSQGRRSMEEGLQMLDDALGVRHRDRVPLDWARTMIDIAYTRLRLGQRTGDAALVRAAWQAAHETLPLLHRETNPVEHAAATQHRQQAEAWLAERGEAAAAL